MSQSRYAIIVAFTDSTVLLTNGVPARGLASKGRYEYYKSVLLLLVLLMLLFILNVFLIF